MAKKYDFCGYATRNDLRCSDGRTIRKNAFKGNDGKMVPVVWQHCHNDPKNVLGKALLENREDGVYCYGVFNDTENGLTAKDLVEHGDINALSIYANGLQQNGGDVVHGDIKEVSLVLAGANPGAFIESLSIEHSDEISESEAILYTGEEFETGLEHADTDNGENKQMKKSGKSLDEIIETMNEEQKEALYACVGQALNSAKGGKVAHSDVDDDDDDDDDDDGEELFVNEEGQLVDADGEVVTDEDGNPINAADIAGDDDGDEPDEGAGEGEITHSQEGINMKQNCFAQDGGQGDVLTHSDITAIFDDAKSHGSLKDAVLAHTDSYGVEPIDMLFPNAKAEAATPDFIKRDTTWVNSVMSSVHHLPWSRIKSIHADITEDEARARGYMKGNRKKEEVFTLLKRETTPTTVYKKQKLDRDDIVDITDFDIVVWIKSEMRGMLDEEIARAILIGDGRSTASDDKINELCIRPIWTDDPLYTINTVINVTSTMSDTDKAKAFIKTAIKSRKQYKGSGRPVLFTTEDLLTDMLLIEDGMGRDLYDSEEKLCTKLRVSKIVTVEIMENISRVVGTATRDLAGIIVNLNDYAVGADKGGAVNLFDDFDIDFNQYKYLIETRCSGALRKPFSAIAIEFAKSTTLTVTPTDDSTTRYGMAVSSLQSGIRMDDAAIKGKLNYVTGYTGYSSNVDEQSGNYLAIDLDAPEGTVVTAELLGGIIDRNGNKGPVVVEDGYLVVRISSKHQKIKVTAASEAGTIVKTFDLSGVELITA